MTHEAVARQVGKSRVAVSNALRLLDLAPETRQAITDGRLRGTVARSLRSRSPAQRAVLQVVLERGLAVRQTEELRSAGSARRHPQCAIAGGPEPDLADLEAQLRGILATKVGIVRTRKGGRLVIDFYSDEELDRLDSIITRGAGGQPADAIPSRHIRRPRRLSRPHDRPESGQSRRTKAARATPPPTSSSWRAWPGGPARFGMYIGSTDARGFCNHRRGRSSITASTRRWRTRPRAST